MFNNITFENIIELLDKTNPITTALISSVVAFFVAWGKTRHEIKKFVLSSKREDILLTRKAFSAVISELENYCNCPCTDYCRRSLTALSDFLVLAPKSLKPLLMNIYSSLNEDNPSEVKKLRKELFEIYSQHIDNTENNPKSKEKPTRTK